MTTLELTLNLPDSLAQEAKAAGLLTPEAIEQMLKRELKRRAGEQLLESARVLQAIEPRLSEPEIETEIDAARPPAPCASFLIPTRWSRHWCGAARPTR